MHAKLNWPNRISIARLLFVAPFVVLVMNQNDPDWPWARYAALGVFVLMAMSDAVDGFLARRLKVSTRLGAILDPLADKVLVFFAVILLSMKPFAVPGHELHNWLVVAVVGKDLWVVAGFLIVYLVTDKFLAAPSKAGKAATLSMCVLVPMTLVGPELNDLSDGLGRRLILGLEIVASLLCVLAVISYTRLGVRFVARQQQPLPTDEH